MRCPRPYRMMRRQNLADANRERILAAARLLPLAEDFSEFTMEAVARKAGVIRPTVYYQFASKTGLLEELYNHNHVARRGEMNRLADVFQKDNDPVRMLHDFVRVFAEFWASDRDVIRRLPGLGTIDSEIGQGLRARNERRRRGARVIVERYGRWYPPLTPLQEPIAIDTLPMLTRTFDALAVDGRTLEEIIGIIQKMADRAIGFTPWFVPPRLICSAQRRLHVNEYFAVLDLDGVRLQLLIGMILGRARLRIPSPAMPGADHLAVFNHSLSQRAALMQAYVIHGADLSPDVGNADHLAVAGEIARFVDGGEVGLGNDFDEGHSSFSGSFWFPA